MDWISVTERLPSDSGTKLVFIPTLDDKLPFIGIAWFEPEGTKNISGWQLLPTILCNGITHWMELPEPPENIVSRRGISYE